MARPYESLTRKVFQPGITPTETAGPAYWFLFQKFSLLVESNGETAAPLLVASPEEVGLSVGPGHYLGQLDGVSCYAAEVAEDLVVPAGMEFTNLRRLYGLMDEDFFWVGGRGVQVLDWDRNHRFCGRCGHSTEPHTTERLRVCPQCKLGVYPRLDPAVIVAVTWENHILLARSPRHPPGLFSVLAGFVEPGETLEGCVLREVREETGLDVTNIRYFGSQPWPFPRSLMVAFTCESRNSEIVIDGEELVEAAWFRADNLPDLPPPLTISRHLVDWFVEQNRP